MKKFFKGLLWVVVCFVALDVAAFLILPHVVPMQKVQALVKEKVRAATGRDISFKDASFVFWPNIGVRLDDVTLGNPAWAKQKNMLSLKQADVSLALMPLLHEQIVIKRFILDAPDIDLEVSASGQKNWDFSKSPAVAAVTASAKRPRKSVAPPPSFGLQVGRMRLNKGRLTLTDMQKNSIIRLDDINAEIKWPDKKSPLDITGAATYKGARLTLEAHLQEPLNMLDGRQSGGQIIIKSTDFKADAKGNFATQGVFFTGPVTADAPDLAAVLSWIQGVPAPKNLPFKKGSFSGKARLEKTGLTLKNAALTLDDVEAKGDVSLAFTSKPDITANLSLNKLDLDRFVGGTATEADEHVKLSGKENGATAKTGWETTPLDFSGLKAVNADLQLKTQGFTLRGAAVGPSVLTVKLKNGVLRFQSSKATLFGGEFSSDLGVEAVSVPPRLSFSFSMNGVEAEPVLETFAHFKKLSGTMTGNVSVTASGDSQEAIISSLAGKGDFDFKNGALKGIDMVKIAQLIQAHSSDTRVGDGETKFIALTGSFNITRGVASNNDLKMTGAVLRATGQGTIDLPQKYVRYRVTPVLLSSAAPQHENGVSVPVKISGPFDRIKVIPDFAATIKGIAANPTAARDTIRNIRDNFKKNPAGALQNLLGGGLLGGGR